MVFSASKSGPCLSDPVLLAIGRGEIREPALSHFLAHMEGCLQCCKKSTDLVKKAPGPVLSLVKKVSREKSGPPEMPAWIGNVRSQVPRLRKPPIGPDADPNGSPQFGHLKIQEILGEGRAGVVYRATDTQLGREVALKVLRPDIVQRPGMSESFLREAQALAKVRDPHVVAVHAFGLDPLPHIVMEFLEGQTLAKALANGPMEPRRAVRLIRDVARGLAALHEAGLVHRDIKPVNVGLRLGQQGEQAVLLDLGLVAEGDLQAGTPGYMAPELTGQVLPTTAADIFSLGVMLRVMALGGDSGDANKRKPHPSLVPLISRLMSDRPENRPTARQVISLANHWLEKPTRIRRGMLAGVGGLALLGLLGVTWRSRLGTLEKAQDPGSNAEKPLPGRPPDRVLSGLFSPVTASAQVEFGLHDGFYYLLTQERLYRSGAKEKGRVSVALPFVLDKASLVGDKLAIASALGEIEVWDLAQWPPRKITKYTADKMSLLSLSLAPDYSGALLVVAREMVMTALPENGKYPPELRKYRDPGFYANGIIPVSMHWGDTPGTVLGLQSRGGITLHQLGEGSLPIWAFRPFSEGPPFFSARPGVPGCLALASPRGEVALAGPERVTAPNLAPHLVLNWGVKLSGRIAGLAFANPDVLVVHTTAVPTPLKWVDVRTNGSQWSTLRCPSPVTIQGHPPTETLHVLTGEGNIEIWDFNQAKKGK